MGLVTNAFCPITLKKELPYFQIDDSYGSCQDWFSDSWMNRGGCGAVTACDTCIYLSLYFGKTKLYPYDVHRLTKEDFISFGMQMKPFLSPRPHGINKTVTYMDGFRDYLDSCDPGAVAMRSLEGDSDVQTAEKAIKDQLDAGLPVPYLMLLHHDGEFEDYNWHWFLLNGYEETEDRFLVKAVTYSEGRWLDFRRLWDTQNEEKGGIVLYALPDQAP